MNKLKSKTAGYILSAGIFFIFIISFFLYHKIQKNPWWDDISLGGWGVILSGVILLLYGIFHKDKKKQKELQEINEWLKGGSGIIILFLFSLPSFAQSTIQDSITNESYVFENDTTQDTIFFEYNNVPIEYTKHKTLTKKRICVDCEQVDSFVRIENLEIGVNNKIDIAFFMQCQFPIHDIFSGRLFLSSFRVNKKHTNEKVGHFSTGAIDLTVFKFPVDLSFGIDNDRLGHNPYRRSEFIGTSLYLSDMERFHKIFHIFRYSAAYHFYHKGSGDTSFQENSIQHSVFIQTQPVRYRKTILSTETYFLSRGKTNLLEIDLGLRHKKMLEERLIIGATFSFENYKPHAVYGFLRFSLIQTSPKKGKRW